MSSPGSAHRVDDHNIFSKITLGLLLEKEFKCWQWTFLQIFSLNVLSAVFSWGSGTKKNIVRFRKISYFSLPDCRGRCSWKSSRRLGFFSWCDLKRWSLVLKPSQVISPLSSTTPTRKRNILSTKNCRKRKNSHVTTCTSCRFPSLQEYEACLRNNDDTVEDKNTAKKWSHY